MHSGKTVFSKSLLGTKQRASREFKQSDLEVTAIEIKYEDKYVAHRFTNSRKWSSFL